jgi:hypothetical protein
MLNLNYVTFVFKKHIKSGIYVDYFSRLIGKLGVMNLFIWSSLYIGEKFLIEYTTRFTNNNNKLINNTSNNVLNVLKLSLTWILLIFTLNFIL